MEKRLAQIEELKQKIENAGKDAETYYQEMTAAQEEKAAKNEAQKGFFEKREALSARISDLDKRTFSVSRTRATNWQNDRMRRWTICGMNMSHILDGGALERRIS